MKIFFYSYKEYEKPYFEAANKNDFEVQTTPEALSLHTVQKAKGFDTVSVFVGDDVSANVLVQLYKEGVRYIAVRAAGFDNVDISKANELGIKVANVPEYSPHAIAEHAIALMLALNRKLIIANKQVHNQDFRMDNLIGFDLYGKTVGIIGTGKIGGVLIKILKGFGCRLLGYDVNENKNMADKFGLEYVSLPELCVQSDIISMHTCLTPQTFHIINAEMIRLMKKGVMLINTSRGACLKTEDVIPFLENGHIGYMGIDVYEKEKGIFFYDWSGKEINDTMLKKLMAMPNVIITPHQAFATQEALTNIATTTFNTIESWLKNKTSICELTMAGSVIV